VPKEPSDFREAQPLKDVLRSATTMSGAQNASLATLAIYLMYLSKICLLQVFSPIQYKS